MDVKNMNKDTTINHSEIIDRYGVVEYYKKEKKLFVGLCKERGLSQSQTHEVINIWLKSEGQKSVSLSYIKHNW